MITRYDIKQDKEVEVTQDYFNEITDKGNLRSIFWRIVKEISDLDFKRLTKIYDFIEENKKEGWK